MSRARIVTINGFCARADHLTSPSSGHDQRSAVGFAQVSVADIVIIPGDRTIGFPDGLARVFVERLKVLQINAVERENNQLFEKHRRRGGAAVMTAAQILALPEDLPRGRVQAGGAVTAEVDINTAGFKNR